MINTSLLLFIKLQADCFCSTETRCIIYFAIYSSSSVWLLLLWCINWSLCVTNDATPSKVKLKLKEKLSLKQNYELKLLIILFNVDIKFKIQVTYLVIALFGKQTFFEYAIYLWIHLTFYPTCEFGQWATFNVFTSTSSFPSITFHSLWYQHMIKNKKAEEIKRKFTTKHNKNVFPHPRNIVSIEVAAQSSRRGQRR